MIFGQNQFLPFSKLGSLFEFEGFGPHHLPAMADKIQFRFPKGFLDYQNKLGIASMYSDSHMTQMSNELLFSPQRSPVFASSGRGSTITTSCNEDNFSEVGAVDGKPFFSNQDYQYSVEVGSEFRQQYPTHGGATNKKFPAGLFFPSAFSEGSEVTSSTFQIHEQAPQVVSKGPNFAVDFCGMSSVLDILLQQESPVPEQKQWQHYLSEDQCTEPFLGNVPGYFSQQSEFCSSAVGITSPMHSQRLSKQLDDVHVAPERSSLLSCSKGSTDPRVSNNSLRSSIEGKILRAYCSYRSSAMPTGDCVVSFVNHMHARLCKDGRCLCKRFYSLVSHFNKCQHTNCDICAPILNQCLTHKCHQCSKDTNGSLLSSSPENMLPPAKRLKPGSYCSENSLSFSSQLKMDKACSQLSSENKISKLASLMVQSSSPEALAPMLQWPESPVSINSEVLEGGTDFSAKPMQNHISFYQNGVMGGDFSRLNTDGLNIPAEVIVAPKSEVIDSTSYGAVLDFVEDETDLLKVNTTPIISEELGKSSKEEVVLVMPNFDLAKPDLEAQKEEERKPEERKISGVSLIEFFSAEEIKNHISSLQQLVGKRTISKEGKEKQGLHYANENICQLCEVDKIFLTPVPIYCSSCGSRIKRGVIYYATTEENGLRHCFCTLCYKARGGSITFFGITIPKAKLDKKKNDEEIEEPWVQCDKCKSWQHQICALFNGKKDIEGKSEYICPKCCLDEIESKGHRPSPEGTILGAKDLPSTSLSDYIEQRLYTRLQQEKEEKANATRENIDEVPGAEDLVVRVVLSVNKKLKVKKQFLEIFQEGDYPDEFSYKSKVILLFQKSEGVDVCLFGMYVQEFGSDCSQPNNRCVYISYLDSVKYFRPERKTATGEALRTFVYHEILIGYLEYCKQRGFAACYLWACPPLKGEDYILYSHPAIQKTPKSDKLRQWYHSMIRKAAKENVVVNFTNLYDLFFVPNEQFRSKVTAARLPYFDGDYWSGAAENIINNFELKSGASSGRKMKKSMTKRSLKAMGHANPSTDITKDVLLMQKLGQTIFPVKEDFFVLHLQFICTCCHGVILSGSRWSCSKCKNFQLCERCHDVERGLNGWETHSISSKEKHLLSKITVDDVPSDTKDDDVALDNWLFENRHILLGFCQKNHHQFDTLRRAKHSSMMILHYLHNPGITADTTCNICQRDINSKNKNVCTACQSKKLGSSRIHKLVYESSTAQCETESTDTQEKLVKLKELLDVLQHSSQCKATNGVSCTYPNCILLRRLFFHASKCSSRVGAGCTVCIKAWKVLLLHASICRQLDCNIPRCRDLKNQMHETQSDEKKNIWTASKQIFREEQNSPSV